MSENLNKKENEDNLPEKENIIKKGEEKIEENKQNEIDNNKDIFFQKLSIPFHKRKNNSINNNIKNRNKNNIILRNNRLVNDNLFFTHNNINNYSKKNLSYIINENGIFNQIQNENINLNNINNQNSKEIESNFPNLLLFLLSGNVKFDN